MVHIRNPSHLPAAWFLLFGVLLFGSATAARAEVIERIEVHGLSRMNDGAFRHALEVKEGDTYDPARLRKRFRFLWKGGWFDDIVFEAETTPTGGKILIIKVKERPTISAITYEENKIATQTQIEDRLKEKKIRLRTGQALDQEAVFFAEATIRDLLAEKGFLASRVEAEIRRVTETTRAVHFSIEPGGKTRIRGIAFTGNEILSDRKLKTSLELTRERAWYWPWSAKNLYHPVKWDQDVSSIRDAYQNRGYLDVEIGAPVVEVRPRRNTRKTPAAKPPAPVEDAPPAAVEPAPGAASGEPTVPLTAEEQKRRKKEAKKQEKRETQARRREKKTRAAEGKRWIYLSVPVKEGPQYKLGEITFTGNAVFDVPYLRAQIPLVAGTVLNNAALEAGVERIGRRYEDKGYLYSNVVRRIERRSGEPIADVEVEIDEDEPYFVGRIDFAGNTATQDRVLRRELQVLEGDLFSRTKLDVSRLKVNQLGYWQTSGEPVIEPLEGENRVKITFLGEEQGRNEIQVGGGYSGLEGAFFNGVYSTRNFLGRGQVLSVAMQVGGRSNRYQISFQEPWFLGRPYLFGASLFRRDLDYGSSLRSTSSGFGVQVGKDLSNFSEVRLAYNFENVTSRSFARTVTGETIAIEAENTISSLTPNYVFSTVNNPYRPTRGKQLSLSVQMAGGGLGGDTSFIKPLTSFTWYRRAIKRSFLAFHAELGLVRNFGDATLSSANIDGVPRFQRFWLGGDTQGPRAFETRTITPRRYVVLNELDQIIDVLGDPSTLSPEDLLNSGGFPVLIEVGGDRMFLVQSEFVVPMNQQAELALWLDAGDALFDDTSLGFETTRASAGVELRFHLPIFPVPLRLIYGVPIRKLQFDRTSQFTFSIGRSF